MTLTPQSLQRSQSLQEQAYQALRTSILSGTLFPGQRLVETQLAQMLQVSRTPIREALRQLQQSNLAVIDAHGVMRVALFTSTDAMQLYECRIALEQVSVSEACRYATDDQLKQISALIQKAEKLLSAKPTKLTNAQLLDVDYQFHRAIAQASRNEWLVSLLDQLFDKMMLLRIQTMHNNPAVLEIRLEHRQVYDAIAGRDAQKAVAMTKAHLIASQARVVRELEQLQQQISAAHS
ncbi:GntR family transcriptional regulator [Myxacorys almedinensis]|uniref:GntR family transcriptional regulator n=1 Tax=Myxacorys almedinensis TaxID=2651157 RepID=UPI00192E9508|nr:GntR family transcriptional regulator [Myxacorys almedinensis]